MELDDNEEQPRRRPMKRKYDDDNELPTASSSSSSSSSTKPNDAWNHVTKRYRTEAYAAHLQLAETVPNINYTPELISALDLEDELESNERKKRNRGSDSDETASPASSQSSTEDMSTEDSDDPEVATLINRTKRIKIIDQESMEADLHLRSLGHAVGTSNPFQNALYDSLTSLIRSADRIAFEKHIQNIVGFLAMLIRKYADEVEDDADWERRVNIAQLNIPMLKKPVLENQDYEKLKKDAYTSESLLRQFCAAATHVVMRGTAESGSSWGKLFLDVRRMSPKLWLYLPADCRLLALHGLSPYQGYSVIYTFWKNWIHTEASKESSSIASYIYSNAVYKWTEAAKHISPHLSDRINAALLPVQSYLPEQYRALNWNKLDGDSAIQKLTFIGADRLVGTDEMREGFESAAGKLVGQLIMLECFDIVCILAYWWIKLNNWAPMGRPGPARIRLLLRGIDISHRPFARLKYFV